jgi:hypothetical protein
MNQQDEVWKIETLAGPTFAGPHTGEPFEISQIRLQYERMKTHAANQEDKVIALEDENRGLRMAFKLIVRELKEMK